MVTVDGKPVLDAYGNVRGGLRSPYLDVPTSTWNGNSTGASFCSIAGHEVPFTKQQLRELYPSRGAYVRAVTANTRKLVAQDVITAQDGRDIIRKAVQADTP